MTPVTGQSQSTQLSSQEATQVLDLDDYKIEEGTIDPYLNTSKNPDFAVIQRRHPPLSDNDTIIFDKITLQPLSLHDKVTFIENDQLIKVYPMKFLPSPDKNRKTMLAITESGKHIIHQQAQRSCCPASITMLALDLGGAPLYKETIKQNLTSFEREQTMLKEAKLISRIHKLAGQSLDKAIYLTKVLAQSGPGLLSLSHPSLGGHVVVLDAISLNTNEITLRDPYHGWMVTAKLSVFIPWIGGYFTQVELALQENTQDSS